VGSCKDIFQ